MNTPLKQSPFAALKPGFKENAPTVATHDAPTRPAARVGKPLTSKRRDPNYQPVSTFVRKEIHRKVRIQLVEEGRDLADLLDELLTNWLRGKGIKL